MNFKSEEHTADLEICCFKYCDAAYDYLTCIKLQAELLVGLNIMPWRHKDDVKVKV
jgi:hypothetical protein